MSISLRTDEFYHVHPGSSNVEINDVKNDFVVVISTKTGVTPSWTLVERIEPKDPLQLVILDLFKELMKKQNLSNDNISAALFGGNDPKIAQILKDKIQTTSGTCFYTPWTKKTVIQLTVCAKTNFVSQSISPQRFL